MHPGGAGGCTGPSASTPRASRGLHLAELTPVKEIKPHPNDQGWRFVPRWARGSMAVQRHLSVSSGCREDFKCPAPRPEPPRGHKAPAMGTPWGAALGESFIPSPSLQGAGQDGASSIPLGRGWYLFPRGDHSDGQPGTGI